MKNRKKLKGHQKEEPGQIVSDKQEKRKEITVQRTGIFISGRGAG
jgi:hypothetical protein